MPISDFGQWWNLQEGRKVQNTVESRFMRLRRFNDY